MTPCYLQMNHLLLTIFFMINSLTKLVSKQVKHWDILLFSLPLPQLMYVLMDFLWQSFNSHNIFIIIIFFHLGSFVLEFEIYKNPSCICKPLPNKNNRWSCNKRQQSTIESTSSLVLHSFPRPSSSSSPTCNGRLRPC